MTDKIFNIDELRKMSQIIIPIPDFEGTGTINIKVQKPRLMKMMQQGEIPNHLIGIATQMITGKKQANKKKDDDDDAQLLKDAALMMELYSKACMIEPTYEEFEDIMTDEQGDAIFRWAMGEVNQIDSFRTDKADGTNNNNSKKD